MKKTTHTRLFAKMLCATALVPLSVTMVIGQDDQSCTLVDGVLPAGCEEPNAVLTTAMSIGVNTERSIPRLDNSDGFVLSIDGETIDGDPRIEDRVRQTDVALAKADIRVTVDGLDVKPRLDVEAVGGATTYAAGATVTLQSRTNYPAFLSRGEVHLFARGTSGNTRLVRTVPLDPNGQVSFVMPVGEDITVVHRVYDANGRYDETRAVSLTALSRATFGSGAEEGTDRTVARNIRVNGGAVTVSASNVASGAEVQTLGETVRPASNGRMVIQRILPPGDYAVNVVVRGGQATELTREVEISGSDWFYFAVADLTFAGTKRGDADVTTQTTGRLTYYVDGKTAAGVEITSSLDTGEERIEDLFRRLDEKDPRSVLNRIDPNDGYLTYGDDSVAVDNTPTSGKFYLRIAQDDNFLLWGDYRSTISGSAFLRNERTLYGAQAGAQTRTVTTNGDARVKAEVYASQPDQLAAREVFRGTGGSVYFLEARDISVGTETLTIETRDTTTGRVLERRVLVEGRDYDINYLQGVIVLRSPLTGEGSDRLIRSNPGGDIVTNLVANYEFTPTSADIDGFSYGGRVEAWATDDLRIGVTATEDTTGVSEQHARAADLRYLLGDNSFVQLDYATSEGAATSTVQSTTGGLIFDQDIPFEGEGEAYKLDVVLDLEDLGVSRAGTVKAYAERRTEGFATLDFAVTDATGDEELSGFSAAVDATDDALGFAVYADLYENGVGEVRNEYGAELTGRTAGRLSYEVGVEALERTQAGVRGDRIDVGAKLAYAISSNTQVSIFGQSTINESGLDAYERLGLGLTRKFGRGWALEGEISDGTGGAGGRVLASYEAEGASYYFGYSLDPGRALDAGLAAGDAGGRFVSGGRNQVTEDLAYFGENTFDVLGERQSLTSAYGAEYQSTQYLTFTTTVAIGQVDVGQDAFDQTALTFGVIYKSQTTQGAARIELREDRGTVQSEDRDADTIAFVGDLNAEIDAERRFLFSAKVIETQTNEVSLLDGSLYDVNLGYAYRPINDERLNILARYRYLQDDYGQETNGLPGNGAVQLTHVVSAEASYDINRNWTIGGKLGGRFTDSAAMRSDPLVSNDAWLAVLNARYNVVSNWDVLIEARQFEAIDAGLSETSALGAVYRHVGNNAKVGVGYNFGSFSDDLTDLEQNDQGAFINIVAKY